MSHDHVKGGHQKDDHRYERVIDVPVSVEEIADWILPPVKQKGRKVWKATVAKWSYVVKANCVNVDGPVEVV